MTKKPKIWKNRRRSGTNIPTGIRTAERWKVRNGIWVAGLVSWKNHGMKMFWRRFNLFFTPINCIVLVTPRSRRHSTSPSNSTTWRRSSSITEIMIFTPILTLMELCSYPRKMNSSNQLHQEQWAQRQLSSGTNGSVIGMSTWNIAM